MSSDHGKRKKREAVSQQEIGGALRDFFDHVTSHDPEGVHAAMCVVANQAEFEEGDEDKAKEGVIPLHICNFVVGDPDMLADMIMTVIDHAQHNVEGFSEAMERVAKQKMLESMMKSLAKAAEDMKAQVEERKGLQDAEPVAKEALQGIMDRSRNVPGNDTKH